MTLYRPTYTQVETVAVLTKTPILNWLILPSKTAFCLGLTCILLYHSGNRLLELINRSRLSIAVDGFWYGFIGSTATFSLASTATGYYLASTFNTSHNVKKYPSRQKASQRVVVGQRSSSAKTAVLDANSYRKLPLAKKIELSPNVFRLVFALPRPSDTLCLPTGQHISMRAVVQGESVIRSYTPISNDKDKGVIDLVVKIYEQGILTKHLASLQLGDEVDFRGPMGRMKYRSGFCGHIGMVAGGTGIAPMYQLIRAICEDSSDQTTVSLLYANNYEEDILLRDQLDHWAAFYPNKFQVAYFLQHPPKEWKHYRGFVTKDLMLEKLGLNTLDSKLMLCGPPGMISVMKGYAGEIGLKTSGAMYKAGDQVFVF